MTGLIAEPTKDRISGVAMAITSSERTRHLTIDVATVNSVLNKAGAPYHFELIELKPEGRNQLIDSLLRPNAMASKMPFKEAQNAN